MPSMAKVRYHDDPADNRGMLRAWMQLRPLVQFLPPTFLSEKAAFLFPNNESGRAQTLRLMKIVSDSANLPPSPEECFTLTFDDAKGATHYGWEAYVRHLAKTYPGKCVSPLMMCLRGTISDRLR